MVGTSICVSNIPASTCLFATACPDYWIIDSRATDLITFQFSNLIHPVPIHSSIRLPNGQLVSISHKGTVRLTAELVLQDVLYVPTFKFNLISTSKLTNDSKY